MPLLGLGDHELTVHFGDFGVEPGIDGDAVEALDLIVLTLGVFRGESGIGFEHTNLRGGFETLGQQGYGRRIDIIDGLT